MFWTRIASVAVALFSILAPVNSFAAPPWPNVNDANQVLAEYFELAVQQVAQQSDTRNFQTAAQWQERQPALRIELAEMLGLVPEPPRGDLKVEIVGTIENEGIVVQRLHFQSVPGLYVTANLYRPAKVEQPLPAILYVCGHSRQVETIDGQEVSYGNKTGYQRHGIWFARHGYVCLVIDTIQWGEFLGTHWGTYRDGRWDWLSSGYTPAGVEAWNSIRALDYLQSLPEVDGDRIGLTGRSGGGAYSWFTAALDDRVKAVVPIAGITDLQNHVVDGCVSGHCDCMYFVNYYRWDYPKLAALIAPRPLLFANSDRDPIFPLDGVLRTAQQVQHVYALLNAESNLGLLITPGGHDDTPELQVGAFRWFDRHLKNKDVPIEEAATERFDRKELKVFDDLPLDERVRTADQLFADRLNHSIDAPTTGDENSSEKDALKLLKARGLSGWPREAEPLGPTKSWSRSSNTIEYELWEFTSQTPWRLQSLVLRPLMTRAKENPIRVHIVDDAGWHQAKKWALGEDNSPSIDATVMYVAVRGIGPLAWTGSEIEKTHIKRRFYLIGQTLEGMQIWDALRGIDFARSLTGDVQQSIELTHDASMQGIAAYAAVLSNDQSLKSQASIPVDFLSTVPLLGQGQINGLKDSF